MWDMFGCTLPHTVYPVDCRCAVSVILLVFNEPQCKAHKPIPSTGNLQTLRTVFWHVSMPVHTVWVMKSVFTKFTEWLWHVIVYHLTVMLADGGPKYHRMLLSLLKGFHLLSFCWNRESLALYFPYYWCFSFFFSNQKSAVRSLDLVRNKSTTNFPFPLTRLKNRLLSLWQ